MSSGTLAKTPEFSFDEGCWDCGGALDADGACSTCSPGRQVVPMDVRRDVYGRGTVFDMLRRMRGDGSINELDDEVAALASEARRLMGLLDEDKFTRGMDAGDLADKIRMTLTSVVSAKEKRQKLLLERGHVMTIDAVRGFLSDVERVLRETIDDEGLLQEIGHRLSTAMVRMVRRVQP